MENKKSGNTPCKCCLKKMEEFEKSGFPDNSNLNKII